jgi:hypothetical protein
MVNLALLCTLLRRFPAFAGSFDDTRFVSEEAALLVGATMCGCPFAVPAVDRPEMKRALRPILGPGRTGTLGTQEKWLLEVGDRVIARGVSSGERRILSCQLQHSALHCRLTKGARRDSLNPCAALERDRAGERG